MSLMEVSQLLGNFGEFIGAIAVMATLGYLAVQIRQNTRTVRITAETALSHHLASWSAEVVRDPELGRIWDTAASEEESLTDDEKRRYLWYVAQLFELYEGQFHLYVDGHIPDRSWNSKSQFMLKLLELPLVKVWWDSELPPLGSEFMDYLNGLKAKGIKVPKHRGVLADLD